MKLTKKHIGGLFDVRGGDGSWVYRLVDVKKGDLLFYSYNGHYSIEKQSTHDWRPYDPTQWESKWTKQGWEEAKYKYGERVI